jgi:hypothetical protein
MRRHVVQLARAVAGRREDVAAAHQRRPDRDLAPRARRRRLFERARHEAGDRLRHLASPRAPLLERLA